MSKTWLIPLLVGSAVMAAFGQDSTLVAPAAASAGVSADSALAVATEATAKAADAAFIAHNLWMMISAALVFIMALGFAGVETGLTRAKNTSNILFKNVIIVGIGVITYAIIGFNLMYPGAAGAGKFFVLPTAFGLSLPDGYSAIDYASGHYTYWTDFIFQAMFAATAATIVSGAVAERVKLSSFLLFSVPFVGLVYPAVGMWKWGGGWLAEAGFWDFAGSTLVHSVGGWGALAGVIVLGPRIGKYVAGQVRPIMGHSMPLATIGVFMLWFGWYGFNGGSVLSADPDSVSRVFVTTTLGAVGGMITSMLLSWFISKAPDLSMMLNGVLAGLVGITAGADIVSPFNSVIVGGVAGILVVLAVFAFDKLKLDDPVGALSVHLVCGIWGTLATGIFGEGATFLVQLKGVLAYGVVVFPIALVLFLALKYTIGVRVSREEELGGLDKSEHKSEAYGGFNIFN